MTKKEKFMHWIGALFYERKDDKWTISIGRISWWLAFSPALYTWVECGRDITDHHMTILIILAGYNLGKKVVDGFKKKEKIDGPG
jgi:hypothetical protein